MDMPVAKFSAAFNQFVRWKTEEVTAFFYDKLRRRVHHDLERETKVRTVNEGGVVVSKTTVGVGGYSHHEIKRFCC